VGSYPTQRTKTAFLLTEYMGQMAELVGALKNSSFIRSLSEKTAESKIIGI
jgi:hypothetical protein